jgi:plastocyanin
MKTHIGRVIVFSVLAARVFAGGTIEGRVQLPKSGTPPMVMERYGIVTSKGVMATNPALAVVYLEGDFPRPATPATVQIVQKDMAFVPALLPIQAGTHVKFPNHDKIYHNVYSYSRVKRFDLGRYQPNEQPEPEQFFDVPGLVVLRCEIHEHMKGLILILDTPHFVVTDAEGRFKLNDLPPGHYVLKAWLNSETTREQPVDIVDGITLRADFP